MRKRSRTLGCRIVEWWGIPTGADQVHAKQDQEEGHRDGVEHAHAAVDNSELIVLVEVGDNAGSYSADIQDIKDRDSDENCGEEASEVSCFSVLFDNDEKEKIEEYGKE